MSTKPSVEPTPMDDTTTGTVVAVTPIPPVPASGKKREGGNDYNNQRNTNFFHKKHKCKRLPKKITQKESLRQEEGARRPLSI